MDGLILPSVTLLYIDTGGGTYELTRLSAEETLKKISPGAAVVLTDRPDLFRDVPNLVPVDVRPSATVKEAMDLLWYEAPRFVKTEHVLYAQWDSWVLDASRWTDEFLEYDYVGAPWWYPTDNVGNGGFSLRSRRLMTYLAERRAELPNSDMFNNGEDTLVCRVYRLGLEAAGFKWPSDDLAWQFSVERSGSLSDHPFGFHGIFNWPQVLTRGEIFRRAALCPVIMEDPHYREFASANPC